MKKILVALMLTATAIAMASTAAINSRNEFATDLIISEYVEGSSNNKAIEIFNGTGVAVDLSTYALKKQSNGVGDFIDPIVVNRTLAHNETFVIANSGASATVADLADTLVVYNSAGGTTLGFNGNDAVGLFKTTAKGEEMIDVVGVVGSADNWGKDITLVRNSSVSSPSATYAVSDWTSYGIDVFTYLGSHTMDILPNDTPEISATPSSLSFGGLNISEMSEAKEVKIFGKNLTDNIVVTAPEGFGIGTDEADNELEQMITLNQTAGVVDTVTLYIRFTPVLEQLYVGNLVCTSTDATTRNIALSGIGLAANVRGYIDFEDGTFGPMTAYSSASNKDWVIASVGANSTAKCAEMNGFQEDVASNDWLMSPSINFDELKDEAISFYTQWKYGTEVDNELTFKYSTDYTGTGDPALASWTELPFAKAAVADTWEQATVDLSGINGGSVYLAFNYQSNGLRRWRVDQVVFVGDDDVSINKDVSQKNFALSAYPNPFNPSTMISFNTEKSALVKAVVYDAIGAEVTVLNNGSLNAGKHSFNWNATGMKSGIYFVKVISGNVEAVNKLVLVK